MNADLKLPALVLAVVGAMAIAIGLVWPLLYLSITHCPCPSGAYCSCGAVRSPVLSAFVSFVIGVACITVAALLAKRSSLTTR